MRDDREVTVGRKPAKKQWEDLSGGRRARAAVLGAVQLGLAVAAWVDLARRPAEEVNGRKGMWAAVIAVNYIGPIAYFVKGRRKD